MIIDGDHGGGRDPAGRGDARASTRQDIERLQGLRGRPSGARRRSSRSRATAPASSCWATSSSRTRSSRSWRNGGDGVGLYRTEFLYLTSPGEPTEEEHFEAYRQALELLEGRPLTIRTVDLGADKYTQARAEDPERNPFLGLRSIRYCLQNLPMFKTQLRAILRASALGTASR